MFFDLEDNLCKRYTALTPFIVRREKFGEVAKLVGRINQKNMADKGVLKGDKVWTDKKGNLHIRREAQNDDWW